MVSPVIIGIVIGAVFVAVIIAAANSDPLLIRSPMRPASQTKESGTDSGTHNSLQEIPKEVSVAQREADYEAQSFIAKTYYACVTNDYSSHSEQLKTECRDNMTLAMSYCKDYHYDVCDESKHIQFQEIRLSSN